MTETTATAKTLHDWTRSDFDNMLWNPWFKEDRKKMIWEREGFPTAAFTKHYELEWSRENKDKAMRYMLFMYDKKSPLKSVIPDLSERKKEAAILAGLDISSTHTADYVKAKSLFTFNNQYLQTMIVGLLKYQNDRDWAMLVSAEQQLWENTLIIYTSNYKKEDKADAKDKAELQKKKADLIKINKDLNETCKEYEAVIFGDNEDVKELSSRMRSNVTPEKIARARFKREAEKED